MKKSGRVLLVMLLTVIPATLWLGSRLPGRTYYLTSLLVAAEILIPFFMAFEGRRPQPRELVTTAVLAALVVVSRVVIPLPGFKPTFAVILLAGIAFGPETGFLVGALGALGSNFFYGQGPYTPWQMMAYGVAALPGLLFTARGLPARRIPMAAVSFVSTVLIVGPLLDTGAIILEVPEFTRETVLPLYATGLPVNLTQGTCNLLTMLLFGEAILEKLERVRLQMGMPEKDPVR